MDNSVYIALSRQSTLFRDMNAVANNIANVNTTGYKAEKVMFTDYLVDDGNRHKMAFSQDIASYRDLAEGAMESTGNELDVAIEGPGYFMVQAPFGVGYTRAGNFTLNNNGQMVTHDGYPVLDEGGQPIEIPPEAQTIEIGENGLILIDGVEGGVLGVREFANQQELKPVSQNLLRADGGGIEAIASRVVQGAIEKSNVNAVQELTRMIQVSRAVGGTAKYIEVIYDLQRKAHSAYSQSSGGQG